MLPISPVRQLTPADIRSPYDTYRAIAEVDGEPLFIHMSGTKWTKDTTYSWSGSRPQFSRLKRLYPQICDGFSLVCIIDLQEGKTYGNDLCSAEELPS
jgi:hypothetical protein